MLLTNHAQKLYRGIEALGGGVIREQVLRAKAGGISHGTFIAARQELCKAGFLAIERTARKPHYRLIDTERAAKVIAESEAIYAQGEVAVFEAKAKESAARAEAPPPRKMIPVRIALAKKVSEISRDSRDTTDKMDGVELKLVPIAIFEDGLPHIAGRFADFADWHEALAEAFGDFDLDEGAAPRTFILYVPARRSQLRARRDGGGDQRARRGECAHRARALRLRDEGRAEPQFARRGAGLPECHGPRQQLARRCLRLDPRQCRRRPRLRDVRVQHALVGPRARDDGAADALARRQPHRQELPEPRCQDGARLHGAAAHGHARHPRRDGLPRHGGGLPTARQPRRRLRPRHRQRHRPVPARPHHAGGRPHFRRGRASTIDVAVCARYYIIGRKSSMTCQFKCQNFLINTPCF